MTAGIETVETASGAEAIVLRAIENSSAVELALIRAYATVLRGGQTQVQPAIIKAAKIDKASLLGDLAGWRDVSFIASAIARLRQVYALLLRRVTPDIEQALRLEESRHDDKFTASVKAATGGAGARPPAAPSAPPSGGGSPLVRAAPEGININPVLTDPKIEAHLRLAVQQNVALIKGISDQTAARLESSLYQHIAQGSRASEIEASVVEAFAVGPKRAKLIARDQAAKFNSTLNRIRQVDAGFKEYVWSTSLDERVRATHKTREGKVYSWNSPGIFPGSEINCRCVALPVLDETE